MTSLSVIKLAVELNKAFGFEAQVKKMMKGCSVLSIEDELQEFMFSGTANPQTVKKEEKKEHKALYPLSKTQLGVYIDCMKNPYSTLYNIPSILTFSQSVDAQKLADCVVKVIKAHPYIMTHLSLENDDIEQAYVDSAKPNVPVEKLTEEQLEAYKKDFVKPHNLMKAPLFESRLQKPKRQFTCFRISTTLSLTVHPLHSSLNSLKRCTRAVTLSLKATPTLIMQRMKLRLKAVMNLEMLKSSSTI